MVATCGLQYWSSWGIDAVATVLSSPRPSFFQNYVHKEVLLVLQKLLIAMAQAQNPKTGVVNQPEVFSDKSFKSKRLNVEVGPCFALRT